MSALPVAKPTPLIAVVSDADLEHAAKVLTGYNVMGLAEARKRDLTGASVILWPSLNVAEIGWFRSFALEICDHCTAKLVNVMAPGMAIMTLATIAAADAPMTLLQIADYLNGKIDGTVRIDVIAPDVQNDQQSGGDTDSPAPSSEAQAAGSSPRSIAPLGDMPDASEPFGGDLPDEAYLDDISRIKSEPHIVPAWVKEPDSTLTNNPEDWPEPLDLSQSIYRGLPLPLELLPDALKPLVSDIHRRTGIDSAPIAFGLLAAISALASDMIKVQPKLNDHTWTVRPVIWPFCVGGSSSGKTPALEEGMRFVIKIDAAAVTDNARKRKDYEHLFKQYEDDCTVARKNKAPRPEEPPLPALREFWVSRGTTEGVTRVLETSPKVVWFSDEFSSLINSWDRYTSGGKGSGDREFVLQLWNGGAGKNTLAGKTVAIENASAVICGGTTPQAIRNATGGKLQADGFLQRCLICMVPNMKAGQDTAPDDAAYATFERILDNLMTMHGAVTVRMSPEASVVYNRFCETVRTLQAHEDNECLEGQLGKWFGLAPRIMLIYLLTEMASKSQHPTDRDVIPESIAVQVCSLLLDWQLSHIQQFWNEVMADKTDRGFARLIFNYLLAHDDLTTIKHRDNITQPHWNAWSKMTIYQRKEAINTLINTANITPCGQKRNAEGFPSEYLVNPRLKHCFENQREQERESRTLKRDQLQKMRGVDREPGEEC